MSRRNPYPTRTSPAEEAGELKPIWRSLEEKGRSPEERVKRAETEAEGEGFLSDGADLVDASALSRGINRRGFLAASTVTAAAGLLEGCIRRPEEEILPYTQMPEHVVPGVPLHFATVTQRTGEALGLLVTSHEGRPTKIEGNPQHPASANGATDIWAQASLMDLYDPDRSTSPARVEGGGFTDATWEEADEALSARMAEHRRDGGRGLHVLAQPSTSPTLSRAKARFLAAFPSATIDHWASVSDNNLRQGTRLAFGRPLNPRYDLARAKVVLSIDADFQATEPAALVDSWRFSLGRQLRSSADEMNRLYVVEPGHSVTGSNADHRLRLASSQIPRYLAALAKELVSVGGVDLGPITAALGSPATDDIPAQWIAKLAADLVANKTDGGALIIAGLRQPPEVHALVAALNAGLGAEGRSVVYNQVADDATPGDGAVPPAGEVAPPIGDYTAELAALADAMDGARTLLILGSNPVYDAPADLDFAGKLAAVEMSIHVGLHRDETAAAAKWHLPMSHELEAWGDLRARNGAYSIQQPLIAPIHGGRSVLEILARAAGDEQWGGRAQVHNTVREEIAPGPNFDQTLRVALHAGVLPRSDRRPEAGLTLDSAGIATAIGALGDAAAPTPDALEVAFVPCTKMLDGRHANNVWLQELPENLTKLVWDNAALLSPATAEQLSLVDRDVVSLTSEAGTVEAAVQILPGVADNTIVASLGWGRTMAGRYGNGQGFDFGRLRTSGSLWHTSGVRVQKVRSNFFLARTQEHGSMIGRPIAIDGTLEEYKSEPTFTQFDAVEMDQPPLWDTVDYDGKYSWGMSIDLTACTGCNACIIACQAENNLPAVGKGQVARGREMYWLRLDRYFVGDENDPQVAFQPIGCQHCEEAPCENVCPVNATSHTPEGLNDMAYNRCIGTRYCANNCPYKVRRFNYLNYHAYLEDPLNPIEVEHAIPETRQMSFNPNVSVRMRGVMEKCTYCVQRLQEAKQTARRDDRPMAEGAVKSACQQTCPTNAIVFGCQNGYPYVVRKGSRLVGMDTAQIAREFGLRDVRIERERVVPDSEHRVSVEQVDTIEDNDAFQEGAIKYTVFSATSLADLQSRDRHYKLLVEVGTRPRTTFLGRIRNPNSEMV